MSDQLQMLRTLASKNNTQAQSIYTITMGAGFRRIFGAAKEQSKILALKYVEESNLPGLDAWMEVHAQRRE